MGALEFLEQWSWEQPLCMFLAISTPHPQYKIEKMFADLIDSEKSHHDIQHRTPANQNLP